MSLIGYCTNVHAGVGLTETLTQLDRHAVEVKKLVSPNEPLGLGLWLSSASATELLQDGSRLKALRDWLDERQLIPYTMNAFPFGDFHQASVKHDVYRPTWWESDRLAYTLAVAEVFHTLLPAEWPGTISTLPLGWPNERISEEHFHKAALHFGEVVDFLERLEERTGRHLRVCIEPEPGCLLQTYQNTVAFFDEQLRKHLEPSRVDRYLGVCHDVCHSAVMFESQQEVLSAYKAAGITVGKVQVSSALIADCRQPSEDALQAETLTELSAFAEDRYLHQTMVDVSGSTRFFEDLPEALATLANAPGDEWRVHYHIPIFVEQFGLLRTSQADIDLCLDALGKLNLSPVLEVETYAWNVLPPQLQQANLAEGIANEIRWLRKRAS